MTGYESPQFGEDITLPVATANNDARIYTSQYDTTSAGYREIVNSDLGIENQQLEALRLLGDVSGKTVLDVGCGEGKLLRTLAKLGAECVGYDASKSQIDAAKAKEQSEPLGIKHILSDSKNFTFPQQFDLASSTLVLLHAHDREDLQGFFQSTFNALKDSGKFVSITYNPEYQGLGEVKYNRRFTEIDNNEIQVDFFKDGAEGTFTSATFGNLSKEDYEVAAKNAGFDRFEWVPMQIHGDSQDKFWDGFLEDCPYIGFIAYK
jgi:cyclopropane fatty-acyl-phospholipid synthase-like methyltransferase